MGIFSRKRAAQGRVLQLSPSVFCETDIVGESEHMDGLRRIIRRFASRDDQAAGEWSTQARILWVAETGSLTVLIHDTEVGWLSDDTEARLRHLFVDAEDPVSEIRCDAHVGWNERIPLAEVYAIGVRVGLTGLTS